MTDLPEHDQDLIGPKSGIIKWLDKYIVNPTHMKDNAQAFPSWWSPSGWRVFLITFGFYRETSTPMSQPVKEWVWLKVIGPGLGTNMWENGILSVAFHLPFGFSMHLKFPKEFEGERWGWAWQFQFGWKTTGNLSATFRIRPDFHDDYNTKTQYWRTKGLREGEV